jgi:hypothetical protein
MDIATLWAAAWPYVTAAVTLASALDAALPQPRPGSHWLILRKIVSALAVNVGNAANGKQPPFATWIARVVASVATKPAAEPVPPAKTGAGATLGALLLAILVGAGLSACSTTHAAPKAQIVTCDGFNAALTAVNDLDDHHRIPDADRGTIRHAVALAAPACGPHARLAATPAAATADLGRAMTALKRVLATCGTGA